MDVASQLTSRRHWQFLTGLIGCHRPEDYRAVPVTNTAMLQ
jgi:hypothetical protein